PPLPVDPPPFDPTQLDPNSVAFKTWTNPTMPPGMKWRWTEGWRRADIGAANGHGNARSAARLQSALACGAAVDGARLPSPETIGVGWLGARMKRASKRWWTWVGGVVLGAGVALLALGGWYRVWSLDGWRVYQAMASECHPAWRDFHFGRVRAGDPVEEVIAR